MLRPEWLAKILEPALEPELEIIDPHHHLRDMDPATWGRHLEADYLADTTSGHRVVGSVFVDCQTMDRESGPDPLRPVGETEWVESVANRFIRDRGERPGLCAAVFAEWKKSLAELAGCPNVFVKLGGLVMEPMGFGFSARAKPPSSEDLARETGDHHLYAIDQFGPDRCMFESNFPVDKMSCSYTVLWNAAKRVSARFTKSERSALFSGSARRAYRLEDAPA